MAFLESNYLYLFLMLFSISYPLSQSFEHRIRFYTHWGRIFWATIAVCLVFIPWDIWFTKVGVWNFNEKYITGWKLFGLPVEEWSFFIIVPYCCLFIYEVLNYFFPKNIIKNKEKLLLGPYILVLLLLLMLHFGKLYTTVTFSLTIAAILHLWLTKPSWSANFLRAYLVIWLPFLIINGALTGSFTQEAVVRYNPLEFMGYRIGTIPFEDSVYNFLMVWLLIWVYESHKNPSAND